MKTMAAVGLPEADSIDNSAACASNYTLKWTD